jgi:hypothetical protein
MVLGSVVECFAAVYVSDVAFEFCVARKRYRVGSVNADVQPLPVPRTTPTSFTHLAPPITPQPQQLWMKQLKLWKEEEKEKRLDMWQLQKGLGFMSQLS